MRYPASEKLEIIRLVEGSHLPVTRTLDKLGIPRSTFHRWYDRYQALGEAGLEDRKPQPGPCLESDPGWRPTAVVDLALEEPELSPRELAVRFTNTKKYFVSEASVYRILKAHDLIASPAVILIKAATSSGTRPRGRTRCDILFRARCCPKVAGSAGSLSTRCWTSFRRSSSCLLKLRFCLQTGDRTDTLVLSPAPRAASSAKVTARAETALRATAPATPGRKPYDAVPLRSSGCRPSMIASTICSTMSSLTRGIRLTQVALTPVARANASQRRVHALVQPLWPPERPRQRLEPWRCGHRPPRQARLSPGVDHQLPPPPRFMNTIGMCTVIVSTSAETVARFTLQPHPCCPSLPARPSQQV